MDIRIFENLHAGVPRPLLEVIPNQEGPGRKPIDSPRPLPPSSSASNPVDERSSGAVDRTELSQVLGERKRNLEPPPDDSANASKLNFKAMEALERAIQGLARPRPGTEGLENKFQRALNQLKGTLHRLKNSGFPVLDENSVETAAHTTRDQILSRPQTALSGHSNLRPRKNLQSL